jgi:hypothetical protein
MSSLTVLILILFNLNAYAQNENPCSDPGAGGFDFWIGEWNISWTDENGKSHYARNIVSKPLGDCVIEENFTFSDGTFAGKSFSVYNPNRRMWEQTWVDNSGTYMSFTGGLVDGRMILSRKIKNKEGNEILQRMIFYDIVQDKLKWNWERSTDGGQTWGLMWQLNYTRLK